MKQLKLDFDTAGMEIKPEAGGVVPGSIEISRRCIMVVIHTYAEQKGGLIRIERKQTAWIRAELEKAVATEMKVLEMPDDVSGFLRMVFREVKMPPDRLLEAVEKNIDAIKMD